MIKKELITFLLLLISSQVYTQNCAPSLQNDKLQTGTYTFVLANSPTRNQCYTATISQNMATTSLQLGVGISNILNYQNINSGVDFSLRSHLQISSLQMVFNLLVNNNTWTKVTMSYILASRTDVIIGSFIADTNSLLDCNKQTNTLLTIPVQNIQNIQNTSTLGVLVFINGLRTASNLFNLQFMQPFYDFTLKQINVTAITDATQAIQIIFLNYVLLDLTKLGLTFSYTFTTSATSQSDFSWAGLVSFSNSTASTLQYAYFSINKTNNISCYGFTCDGCLSTASCKSAGGSVTGSVCWKCGPGQSYVLNSGCVCPAGTQLNAITLACDLICPSNSIYQNGKCACSSGFFNISGNCQTCPAGTLYSTLLLNCLNICPNNQQWINSTCTCSSGTYLINGICSQCQTGTYYTSQTQSCANLCTAANQVYSNGQCICIAGYSLNNGVCTLTSSTVISTTTCPTNKNLVNGVCKCQSNLLQYQGNCYSCPANSAVTSDQTGCVCNNGYSLSSTYTCEAISSVISTTGSASTTCPANSYWNQNQCTCNNGYYLINAVCSQCPSSSYYDGSSSCQACSSYCISCISQSICTSCSSDFFLSQNISGNIFKTFCSQTCGDGKKYNLGCDDGNIANGDGCSSNCTVESGWTCSGGSPTSKDICSSSSVQTVTSHIEVLQNVLFVNAVYQNVKISSLPSAITTGNCSICGQLLKVKIINNSTPIESMVNFIPNSAYNFVVTLIFSSSLSSFTLEVTLNPIFSNFFSAADMNQKASVVINPSNLSTLNLLAAAASTTNSVASNDAILDGPDNSIPPTVLSALFSAK